MFSTATACDPQPAPDLGARGLAVRGQGGVSRREHRASYRAAAQARGPRDRRGIGSPALPENLVVHAGHRNCTNDFDVCPAAAGALHYAFNMDIHDGVMFVHDHVLAMRRVGLGASPTISNFTYQTGPMAFDQDGMLYVHSFDEARQHPVLELVDPDTGERTTCAGDGSSSEDGPASDAAIGFTDDIAFHDGKVYFNFQIGDRNVIRVLEGGCDGDGTVRTIIGKGPGAGAPGSAIAAELGFPTGIAFDEADNLYVADPVRAVILKVEPPLDGDYAKGEISTFAGTGVEGFGGDGGPASSAQLRGTRDLYYTDGHLLVGDQGNDRVRDIDLGTNIITTLAGSGNHAGTRGEGPAALIDLDGVSHMVKDDADGSLYISDVGNQRIIRCNPALQCKSVVGVGMAIPGPATSNTPAFGLDIECSEKTGDCFRADLFTSVFKITPEGTMSVYAGRRTEGLLSGDGGPADQADLRFPNKLALDQLNGDLYIAGNFDASTIRKVDGKTGIITTIAGTGEHGVPEDGQPAISQPFPDIFNMTVNRGVLYVAIFQFGEDFIHHRIIKIENGIVDTMVGTGEYGFCPDGGLPKETCLAWPTGMAVHPRTGEFYFSEEDAEIVRKIDGVTGRVVRVAGDGFRVPDGIDGRFQGDGGPAIAASFWFPKGPIFDAQGNMYIADLLNFVVRKVVPVKPDPRDAWTWDYRNGIISTIAGAPPPEEDIVIGDGGPALRVPIGLPDGIALDGRGNLFITTWDNDFFRFPFAHEDVVWRLSAAATVTALAPLSPGTQVVELGLDYVSLERHETGRAITAQLIDPYGLRGRKVPMQRSTAWPGNPTGERAFFDLRAEVARLAAEGIQPSKLRVETRSDAGRWITGDIAIP